MLDRCQNAGESAGRCFPLDRGGQVSCSGREPGFMMHGRITRVCLPLTALLCGNVPFLGISPSGTCPGARIGDLVAYNV